MGLPLEGIRVVDLTWVWAGPYLTLQLAHMGADVIKVESPDRPCISRKTTPYADNKIGLNRSGYFNQYNQGKRSITLNLKIPAALDAARRLIAHCDVVASNFASGVMDRLGLGYDALRQIRPDIIVISLTGYGETGPYHDYVAYGPAQVALSGLSALTGYRGSQPMNVGFSYGDPNAGIHGAFAVLAALYNRERTGEGQYIDLSQWECAMAPLGESILGYEMNGREPIRDGNRDPQMAPHGAFRCRDMAEQMLGRSIDMWVAIAVADDAEFARLAASIGNPGLASDPRYSSLGARKLNEDALEAILSRWTAMLDAREAETILQRAGVTAAICATNKDLDESEHLASRGYYVALDHPEIGRRKHAGIPWIMSATPCAVRAPAPMFGEHTDEILTDLLGYSADEVTHMHKIGALDPTERRSD